MNNDVGAVLSSSWSCLDRFDPNAVRKSESEYMLSPSSPLSAPGVSSRPASAYTLDGVCCGGAAAAAVGLLPKKPLEAGLVSPSLLAFPFPFPFPPPPTRFRFTLAEGSR